MQDSDFRTEIGKRKNTRLSAVLCASGARWKTFQLAMAFSFAREILNLIRHQGTSGNTRRLQFHVASSTEARSRSQCRATCSVSKRTADFEVVYFPLDQEQERCAYPSAHGQEPRPTSRTVRQHFCEGGMSLACKVAWRSRHHTGMFTRNFQWKF